jgi:hypothetical protein
LEGLLPGRYRVRTGFSKREASAEIELGPNEVAEWNPVVARGLTQDLKLVDGDGRRKRIRTKPMEEWRSS